MDDDTIRLRRENGLGRITLNRPQALNALSLGMIERIDAALVAWQDDPAVGCVLVDAVEGSRGLCAGGDIRFMQKSVLDGVPERTDHYLATEYVLNARTGAYPKPYVAFMDGIVMGGGVGISGHGSVRIVTERTRLAMPEVGIGLLPDVGGTWLLSRAPSRLGFHAALTGDSLTAFDAIEAGLADHHVPADSLPALAEVLRDCADMAAVQAAVRAVATPPEPVGLAAGDTGWMERAYAHDSAEAIVAALRSEANEAAARAASRIEAVCPMSVAVTLRALQLAPRLGSLQRCLDLERHLAAGLSRRPDFVEGVRAAVIDKDRNPHWQPDHLSALDPAACDALFAGAPLDGI